MHSISHTCQNEEMMIKCEGFIFWKASPISFFLFCSWLIISGINVIWEFWDLNLRKKMSYQECPPLQLVWCNTKIIYLEHSKDQFIVSGDKGLGKNWYNTSVQEAYLLDREIDIKAIITLMNLHIQTEICNMVLWELRTRAII